MDNTPAYWNPNYFRPGQAVTYGEFSASVVRHYGEGMWEIRLPGGVACVSGAQLRADGQQPDTQPGAYYVTVIDGPRVGRLLGPFINDHAGALAMVDQARAKAEELDPRAVFYAFGTCRIPADDSVPIRAGVLNKFFNLPH